MNKAIANLQENKIILNQRLQNSKQGVVLNANRDFLKPVAKIKAKQSKYEIAFMDDIGIVHVNFYKKKK